MHRAASQSTLLACLCFLAVLVNCYPASSILHEIGPGICDSISIRSVILVERILEIHLERLPAALFPPLLCLE